MKLRVIYGRSGSGKSHKCLEEITSFLKREERGRAFLLVPEQFMINAERRLLEKGECPGLMEDEVSGFKRLAYNVFKKEGISEKPAVDSVSDILLMIKTLSEVFDDLTYYKEVCEKTEFIVGMLKQIKEFERYLVTPEILKNLSEKAGTDTKKGLKEKLSDIAVIYGKYRELLRKDNSDSFDSGELFTDILRSKNIFKGDHIWIDEFHGFTGREYEIITELVKQAEEVTVCLCRDDKYEPVFEEPEKTYRNLEKIAGKTGAAFEKEKCEKGFRFEKCRSIEHIEKQFFRYPYEVSEDSKGINIIAARSPFDEMIYCAETIKKKVSEGLINYSDISVIISDTEVYEKIAEAVFERYKIPFFMDMKKDPLDNPYAKLIMLFLEAVSDNRKSETVFDIIRTGFFDEESEAADYLELYFKKTGLNGRAAWKKKVNKKIFDSMNQNDGGKAFEATENLRKKICILLDSFEEKISLAGNISGLCRALGAFLKEMNVTEALKSKYDEIYEKSGNVRASDFSRETEVINAAVKKVYEILGDIICPEETSQKAEKLKNYLAAALSQTKVGYVPQTYNCVQIGTKERSRSHETTCVFILGANDGLLPKQIGGYGIISDSDREFLKNNNIETAGDDRMMAVSEQFRIYKALTLAKEELYISYALSSLDNKKTEPSQVVERVRNLFKNVNVINEEDSEEIEKEYVNVKEDPRFEKNYSDSICIDSGVINTSFSGIESYTKCPYGYYLEKVLGIIKEDEDVITAPDYGSVMHEVLMAAIKKAVDEKGKNICLDITAEDCERYVESVADDICTEQFGKTTEKSELSAKIRYIIKRLKKSAAECMKESLKYGVPVEFELHFGGRDGEGLEMLSDGENGQVKVRISGIVDRIDISSDYTGEKVAVLDYKTKYKEDKKDIAGKMAQLAIYADTAIKKYGDRLKEDSPVMMVNAFYDSSSEKKVEEYVFDNKILEKFKAETGDVFARGIESRNYQSKPGNECDYCIYAKICGERRKKQG